MTTDPAGAPADPTAGGTTPAPTGTDPQQQVDAALTQAEQAVADLTERVSNDLQSLRDQVANANAQGTPISVTEIVSRIDQIVVNIGQVDAAAVVQGGSSGPLPPTGGTTDPTQTAVAGDPTQTPAGTTGDAPAAESADAAAGEQGGYEPEGGASAGQ